MLVPSRRVLALLAGALVAFALGVALLVLPDAPASWRASTEAGGEGTGASSASSSDYTICHPDPDLLVWDEVPQGKLREHVEHELHGWLKVPIVHNQFDNFVPVDVDLGYTAVRVSALTNCFEGHKAVLTHCGGPGRAHDCHLFLDNFMMPMLHKGFDNLAITQRGIEPASDDEDPPEVPFLQPGSDERVKPFPQIKCYDALSYHALAAVKRAHEDARLDFDALYASALPFLNHHNPQVAIQTHKDAIELVALLQQAAAMQCREEYALGATDVRGQMAWQDFAGTVDLVHDMDIFRQAVGAEKLSVWGQTYGSEVAATYASVFVERVDRLVLDGNQAVHRDVHEYGEVVAEAYEQVVAGICSACDADYFLGGDRPDDEKCAAAPYPSSKLRELLLTHHSFVKALALTHAAIMGDGVELNGVQPGGAMLMACVQSLYEYGDFRGAGCCFKATKPLGLPADPAAFAQRLERDQRRTNPIALVRAVDFAGRMNARELAEYLHDILRPRHPMGFLRAWDLVYITTAPNVPRPGPPLGTVDPLVRPLVIAELNDPMTTWNAVQQLAQAFPNGRVLSWAGFRSSLPDWAGMSHDELRERGHEQVVNSGWGANACHTALERYMQDLEFPHDGVTCPINGPAAGSLAAKVAVEAIEGGDCLPFEFVDD